MEHEAGKEKAVTEGLDISITLGVYLGISLFIAVFAFVIKVLRRWRKPKFHVQLVLHVSNFDQCQDVTLWRGNKCPHFLRLPARNTPYSLLMRGWCWRPRLLMEAEDLVISDITTGCREVVPTSVRLTLPQAWRLKQILASPQVYCHLEWRHGHAPFPVLTGRGATDQALHLLDHSAYESLGSLQFEDPTDQV